MAIIALATCSASRLAQAQLNQDCSVSVLNRTVPVNPDGSWVLPNIPANLGQVRARATCVRNGVTTAGQSDYFTPQTNGVVQSINITFGTVAPVPGVLTVTSHSATLNLIGATAQLTVVSGLADGTNSDLTSSTSGTNYTTSSPAVATVSPNGLVTAKSSGTAIISAMNEGALGVIAIQVVLSATSHSGIPDDWAIAHGLDPNDPAMPFEDPDHDGLTNLQEFQHGTDPHNPDTDGDGIPDGLEVANGTDPLNPNSFNLSAALKSIQVSPPAFNINFNTLLGEGSSQLTVIGTLNDANGTQIDLTSARRGTNYSSSDLTVCNFGAVDGQIFAGNTGTCTITVKSNGFTATVPGVVRTFSPTPLSFLPIPGFANNVKVNGNFAYVAAGSAGLQVVDVTDRTVPRTVASLLTAGNANDLRVAGNKVYLAAGSAGLLIIDVTNPPMPVLLGSLPTPGSAFDVAVSGNLAFIAAGTAGLQIADVGNPETPAIISAAAPGAQCPLGNAQGVDVSGNFALVAAGGGGLQVVDITNPANPLLLSCVGMPSGNARKVQARGTTAFVAPYPDSLQIVDFTVPTSPVIVATTTFNLGGRLQDVAVAQVLGRTFTFGADVFFVNGVPITDVTSPGSPVARAILDFRNFRDDNGHGIAVDSAYVYMTGEEGSISDAGVSGDTRLYIGQYLALSDTAGIPPRAGISAPIAGTTFIERQTVPVTVIATDDVAVAAVSLTVNGQVIGTVTNPPYQFTFQVPVAVSIVTLGAIATDLGGNIGTALPVQINVIPDPGTTVVGKVVNAAGNPISGGTVSTLGGRSATTGADGSFTITQVPTVLGDIVVNASYTAADGTVFGGVSAPAPPVPFGTTKVGSCIAKASGLIDWWPGDGNANDVVGHNNGLIQGGLTFTPGEVASAFTFNGTDAAVTFGASAGNFGTSDFSIDYWIKTASLRRQGVLGKRSGCGHGLFWDMRTLDTTAGHLQFELDAGDGVNYNAVLSQRAINDNLFHHVAIVRRGVAVSVYIDGVLDASGTTPAVINADSAASMTAGHSSCTFADSTVPFTGEIDEIQLYSRALTSDEVRFVFAAGRGTNCDTITIVPVPVVTSLKPKSALAGAKVTLQVTGSTLTGSTFALQPSSVPPISVLVSSINPSGSSATATATVTIPAGIKGTLALVATNVAGSSSSVITPINRFTVVDPKSNADSDGDGFSDVIEAVFGSDPLDAGSLPVIPRSPGEAESPSFAVLNGFTPARVNTVAGEAESLSFAVLNGFIAARVNSATAETESLSFSVVNGLTITKTNPAIGETESLNFSVFNGTAVITSNPATGAASSLSFSVVNGAAVLVANPSIGEAESLTFSVVNTAPKAAGPKPFGPAPDPLRATSPAQPLGVLSLAGSPQAGPGSVREALLSAVERARQLSNALVKAAQKMEKSIEIHNNKGNDRKSSGNGPATAEKPAQGKSILTPETGSTQ